MYEENIAPIETENNISQLINSILRDDNIPQRVKNKLTIATSPLMALSFLDKDEAKTIMSMLNDSLDDSLIYDDALSWEDVTFVPQTRALLYAILKRSVGTEKDIKNDNILIRTSIVENISNNKGSDLNQKGFFSKLLGRGRNNED